MIIGKSIGRITIVYGVGTEHPTDIIFIPAIPVVLVVILKREIQYMAYLLKNMTIYRYIMDIDLTNSKHLNAFIFKYQKNPYFCRN